MLLARPFNWIRSRVVNERGDVVVVKRVYLVVLHGMRRRETTRDVLLVELAAKVTIVRMMLLLIVLVMSDSMLILIHGLAKVVVTVLLDKVFNFDNSLAGIVGELDIGNRLLLADYLWSDRILRVSSMFVLSSRSDLSLKVLGHSETGATAIRRQRLHASVCKVE